MKKILSTSLNNNGVSLGLLILRVTAAVLLIPHGYDKLAHFADKKDHFMSFMGFGGSVSLALVIGAEFFCSLLLVFGLLSRFALIPLIISMWVAVSQANHFDILGTAQPVGQSAFMFLIMFVVLFITGPGKFSADNALFKSGRR